MSKKLKYLIISISIVIITFAVAYAFVAHTKNEVIKISHANYEALSTKRDIIIDDYTKLDTLDNYVVKSTSTGTDVYLNADGYAKTVDTMICHFNHDYKIVSTEYSVPFILKYDNVIYLMLFILADAFILLLIKCGEWMYD